MVYFSEMHIQALQPLVGSAEERGVTRPLSPHLCLCCTEFCFLVPLYVHLRWSSLAIIKMSAVDLNSPLTRFPCLPQHTAPRLICRAEDRTKTGTAASPGQVRAKMNHIRNHPPPSVEGMQLHLPLELFTGCQSTFGAVSGIGGFFPGCWHLPGAGGPERLGPGPSGLQGPLEPAAPSSLQPPSRRKCWP